jgi:transcriptional regulator GlxA family with amidase domain
MPGCAPSPTGGHSQYNTLLAAQPRSNPETFDPLDRWIAEHLKEDLRVDALAERVHMSPRNFARAYAEKRGCTPAKAVEVIRVEAAFRNSTTRVSKTLFAIACHAPIDRAIVLLLLALDRPNLGGP